MNIPLYSHGYGERWNDVYVHQTDRHKASLIDFHEHQFYEINLILSGNVKVLIGNKTVDSKENKIVLAKPGASHFVSSQSDVLYSSLFLVFSEDFIRSYDIQSANLLSVFGEKGNVFNTTPQQTKTCAEILTSIENEKNTLRKRFLVFYLLSYISDFSKENSSDAQIIPNHIYKAMTYINEHYNEKIIAEQIAYKMHIGRTTLMTQFKKYTGNTIHEYIVNCRLRNAVKLLSEGKSEYEAAINSGFSDSSSLIQCFRRVFKTTPRQYIKDQNLKGTP